MLLPVSQPRPVPPRLERCFGFIDLCGFTNFTEQHGDARAVGLLHTFRAHVRDSASNHGVRVDKWLGDGAMLLADDWAPLVGTVMELQQALAEFPLAMRAGLATGLVLVFEGDDYVGGAINLAAKLSDLAEPGQCLAPAALCTDLPPGSAASPTGAREIPGFAEPLDLVALRASRDRASMPTARPERADPHPASTT